MTRSLIFLAFFNLIIGQQLNAQTATINLLLLDNETGKPLQTNMKWHSLKTQKDLIFKTDKDGKATFVVEGNQTYETSIPQSQDEYDVASTNTRVFTPIICG
jgi:non-ribosomal peptide synthetase component E (peptide arylation enzyme)